MQEITIKGNKTGLKIFINGVPDLKQIPKDLQNVYISTLAAKAAEYRKNAPQRDTERYHLEK